MCVCPEKGLVFLMWYHLGTTIAVGRGTIALSLSCRWPLVQQESTFTERTQKINCEVSARPPRAIHMLQLDLCPVFIRLAAHPRLHSISVGCLVF